MKKIQNFDVHRTVQKQDVGQNKDVAANSVFSPPSICYGATAAQPSPRRKDSDNPRGTYREGGTKYISVSQCKGMIEAVAYAEEIGLSLVAHLTIHWSGTDAGDDANGKLFAKVKEGLARWLRRRGLQFAGIWCREKKAGGQAEVEHSHLIFHLPAQWLVGAKLVGRELRLEGGVELLQVEAALHRLVAQYAGRPLEWAVKLKVPTDRGLPGLYNGRSYDGLYLLKGGGKPVWKLFPRIKKDWRKPQGIIFGKRCGVTQNIGPAARGS
jgi:hypothetical protein